jgi:hypothetical protein
MGTCDGTVCSWDIAGNCAPGSRVTVLDETSGLGAVFEDRHLSGRYHVLLQATRCDQASITVDQSGETSPPTRFVIEELGAGAPPDAGTCN